MCVTIPTNPSLPPSSLESNLHTPATTAEALESHERALKRLRPNTGPNAGRTAFLPSPASSSSSAASDCQTAPLPDLSRLAPSSPCSPIRQRTTTTTTLSQNAQEKAPQPFGPLASPAAAPVTQTRRLLGLVDVGCILLRYLFPNQQSSTLLPGTRSFLGALAPPPAALCSGREFILHILSRSSTPMPVYIVALMYLCRLRGPGFLARIAPKQDLGPEAARFQAVSTLQPQFTLATNPFRNPMTLAQILLTCPRRTFLATIILANHYTHDKPLSVVGWAREVAGLNAREVSDTVWGLLEALDWDLGVRTTDTVPGRPDVGGSAGVPTQMSPAYAAWAKSMGLCGAFLAGRSGGASISEVEERKIVKALVDQVCVSGSTSPVDIVKSAASLDLRVDEGVVALSVSGHSAPKREYPHHLCTDDSVEIASQFRGTALVSKRKRSFNNVA
ncbi:hypothetical protein M427DRAFT_54057 [Gonapodya prolifera JEL478]|uniref:Cyclin N-terminal domain-containing protein n=1 Tax=Gonapodya prolifera (strain JEL478) TaxID=1344416 RepID=A0A139ANB6_GONPJ|nr:hypothetical protein M427DRAFT_54057 [Gonapodya prolifera JEL478]|eukprot:KXS18239.1 hypothetical protein M427DRAFT_54057 [Gonapodya prolifera JEL478]